MLGGVFVWERVTQVTNKTKRSAEGRTTTLSKCFNNIKASVVLYNLC